MRWLDDIRNERWDTVKEFLFDLPFCGASELDKTSLLSELCFHGQLGLVARLLELGADPNFRASGTDASHFAYDLEPGTTAIGQTILGSKWKNRKTFKTLHLLLMNRADPNGITFSGYTPLQLAIVFDRPEFAALLLLYGAEPTRPSADADRLTAYEFARDVEWAHSMLERCWPSE